MKVLQWKQKIVLVMLGKKMKWWRLKEEISGVEVRAESNGTSLVLWVWCGVVQSNGLGYGGVGPFGDMVGWCPLPRKC